VSGFVLWAIVDILRFCSNTVAAFRTLMHPRFMAMDVI
jgi:hypothetical protein